MTNSLCVSQQLGCIHWPSSGMWTMTLLHAILTERTKGLASLLEEKKIENVCTGPLEGSKNLVLEVHI